MEDFTYKDTLLMLLKHKNGDDWSKIRQEENAVLYSNKRASLYSGLDSIEVEKVKSNLNAAFYSDIIKFLRDSIQTNDWKENHFEILRDRCYEETEADICFDSDRKALLNIIFNLNNLGEDHNQFGKNFIINALEKRYGIVLDSFRVIINEEHTH
jgi:hypothetical protein